LYSNGKIEEGILGVAIAAVDKHNQELSSVWYRPDLKEAN
jgi:hypothetical protein